MSAADRGEASAEQKAKEALEFDAQTRERLAHGFVPDLRRLAQVDWFYNNVWRDPEMALLHWQPRIQKIVDLAAQQGGRVLELGCGCGMLSLEMARHGLDVTGVDLSPVSIEVADRFRESNPFTEGFGRLNYICADFGEQEWEDASFDSVVFFRSLHHFPDIHQVMEKTHALLKPGGHLLISEPVRSHFNQDSALMAAVLRLVLPTWEPFSLKMADPWDEKRIEENITKIFEEYTYEGEHHQSEMDNSIDSIEDIKAAVEAHLTIVEEEHSDAFTDKLLGGLRGDHRYDLARMLKSLDAYMIKNGMLPPTSLELHAQRSGV
nr:class I SAM-dependent methyltransferase [Candidatus Krumholzibacteria bacterium]